MSSLVNLAGENKQKGIHAQSKKVKTAKKTITPQYEANANNHPTNFG